MCYITCIEYHERFLELLSACFIVVGSFVIHTTQVVIHPLDTFFLYQLSVYHLEPANFAGLKISAFTDAFGRTLK